MTAATARWAQLEFGSFPADASTGAPAGWRMESAVGAPDEAETRMLLDLAVSRLDSHVPFPAVGRPDVEYETLPRRFGYRREGEAACYWHSTQVDVDGFGRSGNVVSHVILDRDATAATPRHHPIALWRSPELRSPHQYARISLTPLPLELPRAGAVVTRDRIVAHLFAGAGWRIGMLGVLADAVVGALDGGPSIALRCDDQDEAALWLGAICSLLALDDVRRLGFSLYERCSDEHGEGVQAALGRGVHVVVVPRADGEVDGARSVDPHASVQLAQPGGVHVLGDGSRIPARHVAALVTSSVYAPEDAQRVFAAVDDISSRSGDAAMIDAAWPLAMALLEREDVYPDSSALARAVVESGTPSAIARIPSLRSTAILAIAAIDGAEVGAATLWSRLQTAAPGTLAERLVGDAYLERVLRDPAWLAQPSGAPTAAALDLDGFAAAAAGALHEALDRDPADDHAADARLLGFVASIAPWHVATAPAVDRLVRRIVASALADERVAQRIGDVAGFATDAIADQVIAVLDERSPGPDSIFTTPPRVLTALLGRARHVPSPSEAPSSSVAWDVAAMAVLADPEDPTRDRVVGRLLQVHGTWDAIPADGRALLDTAASRWVGSSLLVATRGEPRRAPLRAIRAAVLRSSPRDLDAILASDVDESTAQLASACRDAAAVERGQQPRSGPLGTLRRMLAVAHDRDARSRLQAAILAVAFGLDATDAAALTAAERTTLLALLRDAARSHVDVDPATVWAGTRSDRAERDAVATLAARAVASSIQGVMLDELDQALATLVDHGGDRIVDLLAADGLQHDRLRQPITVDDVAGMLVHVAPGDTALTATRAWWTRHGPRPGRWPAGRDRLSEVLRTRRKEEG